MDKPNLAGIWGGNVSVFPFDGVDFPTRVVRWLGGVPGDDRVGLMRWVRAVRGWVVSG